MVGTLDELDAIRRLVLEGRSENQIAVELGFSRSYVQRRKWILKFGLEDAFIEGRLSDRDILALYRAEREGRLAEALDDFNNGRLLPAYPRARSAADILEKLRHTTDPCIRRALEWAAGLREDLE